MTGLFAYWNSPVNPVLSTRVTQCAQNPGFRVEWPPPVNALEVLTAAAEVPALPIKLAAALMHLSLVC